MKLNGQFLTIQLPTKLVEEEVIMLAIHTQTQKIVNQSFIEV